MYSTILPACAKMDPRITSPKCFYSDVDAGVLVMENLKVSGYDIADKAKGESREKTDASPYGI